MASRKTNADTGELERFGELAAEWWDPNGPCRPLHRINPLRLQWIEEQTGGLAGRRVLDVGCGGGILSEAMAHRAESVTGIDLAGPALTAARDHARDTGTDNIEYREISAEALAEDEPGGYDVVTCMEMLEHVPDPCSIVTACARLTRPGGHVLFSTINRNPKAWLLAIVGAEYVLAMLPRGTHQYERLIRPSELSAWARHAGLDPVTTTGLIYNPLTDRFRLDDRDIDVNYLMAFDRNP